MKKRFRLCWQWFFLLWLVAQRATPLSADEAGIFEPLAQAELPRDERLISPIPPTIQPPASPSPLPLSASVANEAPTLSTLPLEQPLKEISSINFNNVAMIEYLRFLGRITKKNFIFDEEDIQFNVTIISDAPTSVDNLMAALLQELQMHDLSLIEQGNNILIHRNPRVRAPARIVADGNAPLAESDTELVTRVFRLNTLDPMRASEIIRPLLSDFALVEVLRDTNNVIVTDLFVNVNKIAELIENLDSPNSGITIGQFAVRSGFVDSLVDLATKLLQPIAQGNPFSLVPHPASNSIFIVSNPFIVEKALAILESLDMNQGRTRMLSLGNLRPTGEGRGPALPALQFTPEEEELLRERERLSAAGGGPFGPGGISSTGQFPEVGLEELEGPPFPNEAGQPSAIFDETRGFMPGEITSAPGWIRELPPGHIERTHFYIYKLRYRRGDQIEVALRKIAGTLQFTNTNADLIAAINSSQWIDSSNALIFTGTARALDKIQDLMLEVDVPLRQVFIEMLILSTGLADSLTYGVDWVSRFGGGNTIGEEGSISFGGALGLAADAVTPTLPVPFGFLNPGSGGFQGGVIGTHLTHCGLHFNSIGALIRAIHGDAKTQILLNPKIITEDNNTAEIFVGGTDRYKVQSITNDLGNLVTNNFQFIEVGTTLRVTPLIGNNDIITLDIIQETTAPDPAANSTPNQIDVDVNLVPVLTKSRTVTKIHVPDGFFVVLSGQIQDSQLRTYTRIPCLGGIPVLGVVGKQQSTVDSKQNLMIFIRPLILDTDDDLEDVTRRQQDVYQEKSKWRRAENYEIDEALNFGNIKPTDPDEINCSEQYPR